MITLRPSAASLAENLFGDEQTGSFDTENVPPESDAVPEVDWRDVVIPDSVRAAIASHVAARRIKEARELRAGDIVLLDRIGSAERQLNIPVGALLIEQKVNDIWHGFVVAGELDYVSQFDVLIEDQDEPVDPAMRFIQAWNPIEVVISTPCRALGALSPPRIAAIAEAATEAKAGHAASALPPSLTRIGLRQLSSDASVVTGTSIGNIDDPRRHYQSLYKAFAREASVPAIAQSQPKTSKPRAAERKSWLWTTVAGFAATVIVGQSILLVNQVYIGAQEKTRAINPQGERVKLVGPRLKVLFKPNVNYESIAKAVRDIGAQFVSGPDDNGDVVLSVPVERMQEAATVLRIRELVDSIEMLPEQKDAAK